LDSESRQRGGIGDLFTFTAEDLASGGCSTDPYPLMRYFGRASAHGIKGGLFSFEQGEITQENLKLTFE
jgi:hypothetical protein